MSYTPMPSLDQLFDLFYVDNTSPSGIRHAKATHNNIRKAGDVAGNGSGKYWSVRVNGTAYTVHRIIHKMRTGEDRTDMQVDHKDLNRRNNHPFNLRWLSTRRQHQNTTATNETGFKGVTHEKRCKSRPYRATVWVNGKHKSLGYFATAQEAHAAYLTYLENHP